MKYINIWSLLLGAIFIFSGCSDDYMETNPTSETSSTTVFETTENAALAINGMCKLMTSQYIHSQGFNGEGTIKMYYGNYPGNHFTVNISGWTNVINSTYHANSTVKYDYYPWYYYYTIISNANYVLANIDEASGTDSERYYIKAQALTFRAYSYFMLSQLYCKRWVDSDSGSSDGLVLRLTTSTENIGLSTLAQVYTQVYEDLDSAIDLFANSNESRSSDDIYTPNINVAYAVYARASLTKGDYSTALSMAQKARSGYELMSTEDYSNGFSEPTSEWIWGCYSSSDESLYYYSYLAYIGYNSNASNVRTRPKCMSKEIYNKISDTDIRKDLFLDPTGFSDYSTSTGKATSKGDMYTYAFEKWPDLYSTASVYAYMQFKMKVQGLPGVGYMNNIRSSEMYLIEAEANYFLGYEDDARSALITLTQESGRDTEYTTTSTGTDLLDEIKFYRAVELWGEGFDWFDLKRWKDPIERKSWAEGGSFVAAYTVTIEPEDENEWVWVIPEGETDYNDAL